MSRAYLWIAACAAAGCNGILGLDDDAKFLLPDGSSVDAPPDGSLKTCFTETFDLQDPSIWDDLRPAQEQTSYAFSGSFDITIAGPVTNNQVGVITKRTFDLTGGAVEISVLDPSSVQAEGGVMIVFDPTHLVGIVTRSDMIGVYSISPGLSTFMSAASTDKRLRVRHDPETSLFNWETAPAAGDPFVAVVPPALSGPPSNVKIAVIAQQRVDDASDAIALDDLQVTAVCP